MFLTFPEAFRPGGRAMPLPPCCCAAIPKHTGEDDEKTIQLLCLEYERFPPRIAAPAVFYRRGCSTSSLVPPVLHRPFWIRQASRAASAICSACKMGDAVHPPRRRKNAPAEDLRGKFMKGGLPAHGDVSTVAGMRERARDGFGEKASGGGGKAERKIFFNYAGS